MRFTSLLLVTLVFAGCASPGFEGERISADIRYRIFEVERETAERLVPVDRRRPMQEPDRFISDRPLASERHRSAIKNSPHRVARLSAEELRALVRESVSDGQPLCDEVERVDWWPLTGDTGSYEAARPKERPVGPPVASGLLAGFLGVREVDGERQVRIEYELQHSFLRESFDSRIFYRGALPDDEAIVFVAPFKRENRELMHVFAFTASASAPGRVALSDE